jgi:tripeptide aminopeptidase
MRIELEWCMPHGAAIATRDTFDALERERAEIVATDEGTLSAQIDVSRIPAPTGGESARARWVAERMGGAGIATRIDDAGNMIAHFEGGAAGAPVVVCAHLDTVFPVGTPLDIRRNGGRITGPGICDNGRGLAAMFAVARVIRGRAASFARPVEFVGTTGEEGAGDLRGARHYLAASPPPFAFIALDNTGDERIVNSALGSRRFRLEFRGPGGHSWAAYGVVNPVHAAARAAAHLASARLPRGTASALTVSRIGGGHSVNSIPEEAWLEIDARSTSTAALVQMEREIRDIMEAAARQENEQHTRGSASLTCRCDRIGDRPGGETGADSALVTCALEATQLIGRTPQLATASTDANAAMAIGAPAIAIGGGGRGGDTHTTSEWFENDRGADGIMRALTIVAAMAALPAD